MKVKYSKNVKLIHYYVSFFCTRCLCDNVNIKYDVYNLRNSLLNWKTKLSARFNFISWNDEFILYVGARLHADNIFLASPLEFSTQNGPRILISSLPSLEGFPYWYRQVRKRNYVALVRKRTMPTEWPPRVANILRIEGVAWSAQRIPTTVNLGFPDPELLLSYSSSSSVILTRLSGPRSRPTASQNIW
jgi:hypothetical protein